MKANFAEDHLHARQRQQAKLRAAAKALGFQLVPAPSK